MVLEEGGARTEHRYVVHRHSAAVSDAGASIELVLAFPQEENRCEPLFCSLPISCWATSDQ